MKDKKRYFSKRNIERTLKVETAKFNLWVFYINSIAINIERWRIVKKDRNRAYILFESLNKII